MALATLSRQGHVTLPRKVRQGLGVTTGDRIEFIEIAPGRYEVLAATRYVRELKGIVGKAKRVVSVEEINAANMNMGR